MKYLTLELAAATKLYGRTAVLRDIDLQLDGGQSCCLLGKNGAGKTTVLDIVMGLRSLTLGEVRIGGVSIDDPKIHRVRQSVGYLRQRSVLYEHLTGREFLRFIGGLYGPSSEAVHIAEGRLGMLGMAEAADTQIRAYSPGMRRKICLLSALLPDPDYLLLDEPTAWLDDSGMDLVAQVVAEYRDRGRVVLLTAHRRDFAERFSDRTVVLEGGSLVFDGATSMLPDSSRYAGDHVPDQVGVPTAHVTPAHE